MPWLGCLNFRSGRRSTTKGSLATRLLKWRPYGEIQRQLNFCWPLERTSMREMKTDAPRFITQPLKGIWRQSGCLSRMGKARRLKTTTEEPPQSVQHGERLLSTYQNPAPNPSIEGTSNIKLR